MVYGLEYHSDGNLRFIINFVDTWQKSDKSQLLGRTEVLSVATNALSRWR